MFSVIIPVYNGEKYIDSAIGSVMAQTYDDWEIVIVNDGSKDGTAKKLDATERPIPIIIPITETIITAFKISI